MKIIFYFILFYAGCGAKQRPVTFSTGAEGHLISCFNKNDCLDLAISYCPHGYLIVQSSGEPSLLGFSTYNYIICEPEE